MTTTSSSSVASVSITPPNSKSGSIKRMGTLSITRDVEEAVHGLLGHNAVHYMTKSLRLELKADKYDTRLLAFTAHRLYMFTTPKSGPKLEHSYNYVDVSSIESHGAQRLTLGVQHDSRHFTFQLAEPPIEGAEDVVVTVIAHLVSPLREIFPHTPLEAFVKRLELEPRARLNELNERMRELDERRCGQLGLMQQPCAGFAQQYACFCDYFGVAYKPEVAWDINHIHAAAGTFELSFVDFEHFEAKDLLPLVGALTYNTYFTKFRVSNVKVDGSSGGGAGGSHSGHEQLLEQIVNLLRRSTTLEEIYFDNIGVRADFVNRMFAALLSNGAATAVRVIDLGGNNLEDKGLKGLATFIAKSFHAAGAGGCMANSTDDLSNSLASSKTIGGTTTTNSAKLMYKGLEHLNLARCGLTAKGVSELSEALYLNKSMFSTLTYLNLRDNNLKDDISKLYTFLAQPNNLVQLDLSGTDCQLESVFGALLYGCTNNLVHLNLSRNQFSSPKKSSKDLCVPASVKKFFSTAIFLRTINLSHCKLPPEVLKAVLLGLACNESANDIRLDLSSNDFKEKGAAVLELALTDIRCISGLDLSDNALDMELVGVVGAIAKNKSIKHLSIGKNFNNIKAKHLPKVLDSFAQLLQDEHCSLESLSLVDSKLRAETSLVLNALGSNQSLINIDVSGNLMGLAGAKTLAKALQVNTRLETIYLDRNQLTTNGFIDIAYALERNFTLKHLATPVQDVHQAMLKQPERTEAAVNKIQEDIRRNNLPATANLRAMRMQAAANAAAGGGGGHYLANSYAPLDQGLFSVIEKTSHYLVQALASRKNDDAVAIVDSNRIPSVESIDLTLDRGDSPSVPEPVLRSSEYLIRDVANIRGLLGKMQELYTKTNPTAVVMGSGNNIGDTLARRMSSSTSNGYAIARPLEAEIVSFAKELRRTFEVQIMSIGEKMIRYLREELPQVFSQSAHLERDLKELVEVATGHNSLVPSIEYFYKCLTDAAAGVAWSVKLEAILDSIAGQLCKRVLLELNGCLMAAHKAVTGGGGEGKMLQDISLQLHGRSLTPEVLAGRTWHESGSSYESSDLNEASLLDTNANNALATPKLQTAQPVGGGGGGGAATKKQNVYIRKPRPQSVMDGVMQHHQDHHHQHHATNGHNLTSLAPTTPGRVQHLTKSRPRPPKTRQAATRVTIVEASNNKPGNMSTSLDGGGNLDEGLDDFFPSLKLSGNISNDSLSGEGVPTLATISAVKPQPQPRKILRKFGFTKSTDQPDVIHLKNKDFLGQRSVSPVTKQCSEAAATASSHVSICAAEPVAVDLVPMNKEPRIHSPLPGGDPQQHSELLAEMRAKQDRRHLSGDQPPQVANGEQSKNTDNVSVAKRATMFGALHKSPSKSSINQAADEGVCTKPNGSSAVAAAVPTNGNTATAYHPPVKQRPKSIVGMLSGKFELSTINGKDNNGK